MALLNKVIFLDFDGTLAYRRGYWRGVLAEVLREHEPSTTVTPEDLRPLLDTGFPWHTPEIPHLELSSPELWWARIEGVLAQVYQDVGISEEIARVLARRFHQRYVDPEGFVVFEDVVPTLDKLAQSGWRHIIVSNHVPELAAIVDKVGLTPLVEQVVNSACTGYEKPHPEMYRLALEAAGMPDITWMVGDNVEADVLGAERAGIQGILVRNQDGRAKWNCPDLASVIAIVNDRS